MNGVDKILPLEAVERKVSQARAEGKTIGLANGIFDLLHVGHLRYLEEARSFVDVLVVAVNSDRSARGIKGPGRPVLPERERAELVGGLWCTDHVLVFDAADVRAIIQALKPEVHAKGTDYTPETVPERAAVQAYGGRVVIAGDSKAHSTSALLRRLQRLEGDILDET